MLVLLDDGAPEERGDARDAEPGGGHLSDVNDLRAAVRGEVAGLIPECRNIVDGRERVLPLQELRAGEIRLARSADGAVANRDDAIPFGQGQRGVEPRAEHGEITGADRDGDRHSGH